MEVFVSWLCFLLAYTVSFHYCTFQTKFPSSPLPSLVPSRPQGLLSYGNSVFQDRSPGDGWWRRLRLTGNVNTLNILQH